MLLLVGCGGVDLNCEMYPQPREGAIQSRWMHGWWNSPGHGGASAWEGMEGSVLQKRQWDETDEPYMGIGIWKVFRIWRRGRDPSLQIYGLESSWKAPLDSSGTCIHPALRQGTLSVNGLELKIQVGLMESHLIMESQQENLSRHMWQVLCKQYKRFM